MKELRRLFFNPPKGGNEVGVETASSMSPMPQGESGASAQQPLRAVLDSGRMLAKMNATQAHVVGETEFRNYARGKEATSDGLGFYDFEERQEGSNQGTVGPAVDPGNPGIPRPMPSLRPNTHLPYRSDGKPNIPMPGSNVGGNDAEDDKNGGIL
jgi:hypothetical protein